MGHQETAQKENLPLLLDQKSYEAVLQALRGDNHEEAEQILKDRGYADPDILCHDLENIIMAEQGIPQTETGRFIREEITACRSDFLTPGKKQRPQSLLKIFSTALRMAVYQHPDKRDIQINEKELQGIFINCDKTKLIIALQNLIGNAIKYSPEDSPIMIKVSKSKNQIIISISNPSKTLPNNFDPFEKGARADSNIPGQGIGLESVKKTITELGGEIQHREKEVGSIHHIEFTISLPISSSSSESSALIIDDMKEIMQAMKLMLIHLEIYAVCIENTNPENLVFPLHLPDIAFVDYANGNGIKIAEALRKKRKDIYIVIISGFPSQACLNEETFDLWLKKPFGLEELTEAIKNSKMK
jgi:CheY-like chemotaxis protein